MAKSLLLLLCLAAPVIFGADPTRIGGPIAGTVFDANSHSLRPMIGVPGASYLGSALFSGVDAAAVSPDGTSALAARNGSLQWISGLNTDAPVTIALDGAIEGADRIAWSPNGFYAAVYSVRGRRGQIVRDASRAPAAGAAIDFDFNLTALAAGDNGEFVAGAEGGVWLAAPGSAARLIATVDRPSAIAVLGETLFIADQGSDRVAMVEHFASSAAMTTFAEGISTPVGVQISSNGKRLLAASGEGKFVAAFDLNTRAQVSKVDLDFAPGELRSFGGRDIWLLNSGDAGQTLYIADGSNDLAAWFVPAGRAE